MLKPSYSIPVLPPNHDLETRAVLKAASRAHRHLAELKGKATAIPNQGILIESLALQEAKASSEIENIVTTQDELFEAQLFPEGGNSGAAKEVSRYRDALKTGFAAMQDNKGLITNNSVIQMFQVLKQTTERFRATVGTALKNENTGELVYVPPQERNEVQQHMQDLERFINVEGTLDELDPIVKMAIVHHQFESIHPFSDGNGRIGRILNVLYLTKTGLLEIPILYLSRAITKSKADYYRLLQSVRDDGDWEPWIVYMLNAVADTSIETLDLIEGMRELIAVYKQRMRSEHPKIYSQDLLNNLFRHPYTKIEFVQNDLGVTRQTASKYLETLSDAGFVAKQYAGRQKFFINMPLVKLFVDAAD